MPLKKVRMLLRVSSNQQLEADGDLSVQRRIVKEYIQKQEDWMLDEKEYFEGSNSGYSNAVSDRDVLQEALRDAASGQYDILVAYKDDRIGRRMWEIGSYVMALKDYGVDIYTAVDGGISPESDDIMGQMMLALRYGNAQKSSSDTGKRVKDTAQKLVQSGKFMGGKAPYGYILEISGEISKHGRVLHHLVIVEEEAEIVRYIYELAANKEFGSKKIAADFKCRYKVPKQNERRKMENRNDHINSDESGICRIYGIQTERKTEWTIQKVGQSRMDSGRKPKSGNYNSRSGIMDACAGTTRKKKGKVSKV